MSGPAPRSMAEPVDTISAEPVKPDPAQRTSGTADNISTEAALPAEQKIPETETEPEPVLEPKPPTIPKIKDGTQPAANGSVVNFPTILETRRNSVKFVEAPEVESASRRSSTASSLRFETPQYPGFPQGNSRGITGSRIRNASPPHTKFHHHVAFDTINPDIPKNPGITLSARHNGFHAERRSKTFMVGVDENKYSEEALEWLLTSMVDDHDTIVCVRVIEKDVKHSQNAAYKQHAQQLMQSIIKKNKLDKAICIILEYQFGRLGQTFDTMVNVHLPSMLVVGTKGKSNQGMQGMWNTRHSFSKYCLERSPIPVVVVRPEEVRQKKKDKRSRDPNRTSYGQILAATNGVHESDIMDDAVMLATATHLSSADEASQVAKALALPAEFDPTIKGIALKPQLQRPSIVLSGDSSDSIPTTPNDEVKKAGGNESGADSGGEDDDDDDDEDTHDLRPGGPPQTPDPVKKEKLHKMEVGEAAALKKRNTGDLEDEDGS